MPHPLMERGLIPEDASVCRRCTEGLFIQFYTALVDAEITGNESDTSSWDTGCAQPASIYPPVKLLGELILEPRRPLYYQGPGHAYSKPHFRFS